MRSKHVQTLALVLVAWGALVLAAAAEAQGPTLRGSWMVQVSLDDPPPGVPPMVLALRTYEARGTMVESGAASVRTTGHGTWKKTGARRYRADWVFFRFDKKGVLIGVQRVSETLDLDASGSSFESTGTFELLDLSGAVIASGTATAQGSRIGAP